MSQVSCHQNAVPAGFDILPGKLLCAHEVILDPALATVTVQQLEHTVKALSGFRGKLVSDLGPDAWGWHSEIRKYCQSTSRVQA